MDKSKQAQPAQLTPKAASPKLQRPYSEPTLLRYGPVSLMTGSGDISGDDGMGGGMSGMGMMDMMDMMDMM